MSSIIDLGSKYGTYLGEKAVKSSQNQSNSVESERLHAVCFVSNDFMTSQIFEKIKLQEYFFFESYYVVL